MYHKDIEYVNDVYRAVVTPVIVVFGLFGNSVIILTLSRQFVGRFEIYCYVLAIVQSLALISNSLLDDFLGRGLDFLSNGKIKAKLDLTSNVACKSIEFIPAVMYFCSSYVMTVMSVDRLLLILKGTRYAAPNLHVHRTKSICILIVIVGCLLCSPLLWAYEISYVATENVHFSNRSCTLKPSMWSEAQLYFQSLLIFVVPFLMVVVCNSLIVWSLLRRRQLRLRLNCRSIVKKDPNSGSMKLIGYLAISTAFLIVTLPLAITVIVRSVITGPFQYRKSLVTVILSETSKFTSSIKDIHYAINFYLNFLFLQRFRKDVTLLLYPRRCKKRSAMQLVSLEAKITRSYS